MAGKDKIPAPIDRPLSRAYLREFSGWSTAFPPGLSEPTSLRLMENLQVNRDGSLRTRPGLRYLSYAVAPSDYRDPSTAEVLLPFLSTGWKYLQVGLTDAVDRSAPSFDDSAWSTGAMPLGNGNGLGTFGWPVPATPWDEQTRIWARKTITVPEGTATLNIEGRIDNYLDVYIDGELVFTTGVTDYPTEAVSGSFVISSGTHTIAVRATDDTFLHSGDGTYCDIQLTLGIAAGGGTAYDRPFVGTHEPFYLNDGTKAYLLAVRELDETVGFRVMVLDANGSAIYELTHPLVDFELLQPTSVLNFSKGTTYVTYLQIDNKIFALSDNGEPMRMFHVGGDKRARALGAVFVPGWTVSDKLTVVHPDAAWIDNHATATKRVNKLTNPSLEKHLIDWEVGDLTTAKRTSAVAPVSGSRVVELESKPTRTNLMRSPLHDVASTGVDGWLATSTGALLTPSGSFMNVRVSPPAQRGQRYYARSSMLTGAKAGEKYRVAFDYEIDPGLEAQVVIRFLGITGNDVGSASAQTVSGSGGRFVSAAVTAPRSTVSLRIEVGGLNTGTVDTNIRVKNVVVCQADESTAMFHGSSGTNFFWTGAVNDSASTYHPPVEIELNAVYAPVYTKKIVGSLHVQAGSTARTATLTMRTYDKSRAELAEYLGTPTSIPSGSFTRLSVVIDPLPAEAARADLHLTIPAVPRGEKWYVDAAMIELSTNTVNPYFDGSMPDTPSTNYKFLGTQWRSLSQEITYASPMTLPPAETKTVDTLIATGGRTANTFQFGFFYTFSNEVGESEPSKVTIVRTQRGWSEWVWETPNAAGEPSGTATNDADDAADQLVAYMPQDVFDAAIAQGATSWSLYMFTWSDQDPVPVEGMKVGTQKLKPTSLYVNDGWIRVTPDQAVVTDTAPLPTGRDVNYSDPSSAGQGIVAADRMILVNDPQAAAVIRWSSNLLGENANFTAGAGGGFKTLTSGNLYVPACVKLWQNPQSVDTLTILCLGTDGKSAAYYMAPGQVTSQTDAVSFMAFEETTATEGTTSPYGVEVLNNALYHPLDEMLVKSTASNYNISHKSMTELIENRWAALATKYWIMSSQLDNRLYYLVNNLDGDPLEDGCKGNEIWVLDTAEKTGTWSRFKIQGHALRKLEFGNQVYMSVVRPDGVYYLDPAYGRDDYVSTGNLVTSRAIPWLFETNTQGANRAHDAWAHLQQVSVVLGNFQGRARYGIRGYDLHGRAVDISKIVEDTEPLPPDGLPWDLEDHLLIRRDMKEWHLYGESLDGEASSGQLSLVQYRYAPVSVNVGYEYGSVESFEYARNVATGNNEISTNGVPVPAIDTRRP